MANSNICLIDHDHRERLVLRGSRGNSIVMRIWLYFNSVGAWINSMLRFFVAVQPIEDGF